MGVKMPTWYSKGGRMLCIKGTSEPDYHRAYRARVLSERGHHRSRGRTTAMQWAPVAASMRAREVAT